MMDIGWWGLGLLGMALSIAFSILLVVLIVVAIVKLVSGGSGGPGGGNSSLRILDELYAKGEITRDEYLERKSVLRQ